MKTAIPFYLITGFLGAGKTTVLQRLLQYHSETKRIAVIQNDFAGENIDALTLKRQDYHIHLMEINNGSVFCVCLLGGFTESLERMIDEQQPDLILLEASGLADPVALSQLLYCDRLKEKIHLCHTWCVIDALNYHRQERLGVTRHQVAIADTLIINKAGAENRADLSIRLAEINPFAEMIFTTYGCIPLELPGVSRAELPDEPPHQRPPVEKALFRAVQQPALDALRRFIERQAARCWRIKGYMRCSDGCMYAVQAFYADVEIKAVKGLDCQSILIFIGDHIGERQLAIEFNQLCYDI